eukprot:1056881-Pyramimonas_sp.AAC.1
MPVKVGGRREQNTRIFKQRGRFGRLRGHFEPSWSGLGAASSIFGTTSSQRGLSEPSWKSYWALRVRSGVSWVHFGCRSEPFGA